MKSSVRKMEKTMKKMKQAKEQGRSYEKRKQNPGKGKTGILTVVLLVLVALTLFACQMIPEDANNVENSLEEIAEFSADSTDSTESTVGANPELEAVELVRVVDGDTLIVSRDGENVRLRMLCVNCEESVHEDESRNTEKGREASAFTKDYLEDYDTVYLQYDEEMYDQYDRLLAYVWLTNKVDLESQADVETHMFNAILLEEGHAEVVYYAPNGRYLDWFYELEDANGDE